MALEQETTPEAAPTAPAPTTTATPPAPEAPAAAPAEPPPGHYIADLSGKSGTGPASPAEIAERGTLAERLAQESDALPHGPEVRVALLRAAQEAGKDDAEAQAVADEWASNFRAHGLSSADASDLVTIGAGIQRNGIPDEATEERWLNEIPERLRSEFGSPEAAEQAADLARAWVARDPRLRQYLERTRMGSHPRIVLAVAKAARQAHKAGKWRK